MWQRAAMTVGETELQMCVRHVAEQKIRIVRQQALIKRLRDSQSGLLDEALGLLDRMQLLLEDMRAHVARISN